MKVLFHCHTEKSKCSNLKIEELKHYLRKNKIDCIFITDHNEITLINWTNGMAVPSIEIATKEGEIIGAFVKKKIPRGLTMKETIDKIHDQGGLVIAPHPIDPLRKEAMGFGNLLKHISDIDIIEIYNSRNLLNSTNDKTGKIAKEYKKPIIYGSDAHFIEELGNAVIEMDSFSGPRDFIVNLKKAQFEFKKAGIAPHIKTFTNKLRRRS